MSLLVYECKRADHAHEICEFEGVANSMRDYFEGRNELALLIGNVNVGNVELDGIIVKEDAVIILEMKDHSGQIVARMNGEWTCNGEVVRGGSNKTVFEQIQVNRRNLHTAISKNGYFTNDQANDIQGIVVFSKMQKLTNELDRFTKQWLHVSDVANCGGAMHGIKARGARNPKTGVTGDAVIPTESIFNFIRRLHLDESCLVTKMSDVHLLPSDLYHEDQVHDGRDFSTATELARAKTKCSELEKELAEAKQAVMRKEAQTAKAKESMTVLIARLQNELIQAQIRENELLKKLAGSSGVPAPAPVPAPVSAPAPVSVPAPAPAPTQVLAPAHESAKVPESAPSSVPKPDPKPASVPVVPSPASPLRQNTPKASPFARRQATHLKEWDVNNPDEDQLDLIEKTLDKSMLIAGCAGSGKSVIALHKAMKICETGGDVILIAFTKSLNRYMAAGRSDHGLGNRFFYHWQWQHNGRPKADYVIVDEIQDFNRDEIEEFMAAARKSFFFFGDTAQSIYGKIRPGTLSVEQISELTGLKVLHLYNNYRLPKPVAQITQDYVGVDVNPYEEAVYKSNEKVRPRFIAYNSIEDQADAIVRLVGKNKWRNVGVLLPCNEDVGTMFRLFRQRKLICESKFSTDNKNGNYVEQSDSNDSLDFHTEYPKVMTYHSAKGLQFETVILPMFTAAVSTEARKALYVAMTRTYRNLYVMYTKDLGAPLSNVPKPLFKTTE